ncbi:hypothetical protein cypCar_00029693 [Cyprinus carpio]|nr:hypothetical protein cypCar_00029693 [Cyprinus carpio]
MSSNFLCALLILAFLESGKSNSGVSISHSRDGDGQAITCVLSGDENMTQINWEMLRGPNRTKVGTYHPHFGIYIMKEYETKTFAEESDDAPASQSSANGFDPSKLYAKIKKDLFYGRLWKSYQGQPKPWTQV